MTRQPFWFKLSENKGIEQTEISVYLLTFGKKNHNQAAIEQKKTQKCLTFFMRKKKQSIVDKLASGTSSMWLNKHQISEMLFSNNQEPCRNKYEHIFR